MDDLPNDDELFDEILAAILAEADQQEAPNKGEWLARYPGREAVVSQVWRAFECFRALRCEVAPRPPLAVGERLGDFVILSPLASGGMGSVYRARQTAMRERVVALKVLSSASCSHHARERFRREAHLLGSIHHANLVQVYGFGEERGWLFYAMRFVEGPSLSDVLVASIGAPVNLRMRRRIVQRVCEVASGLDAMHRAGLVHRDVKPPNIVLEGPGIDGELVPDRPAVLVDFGLVRSVESYSQTLTGTGFSLATLSYAPPEQLLGKAVDARADVFSLGVTLHDLLARRRPEKRMQASAGLVELSTLDPSIDRDLSAVVAKAVDPDAHYRYRDAGELLADLRAWLEGRNVTARRPSAIERVTRWARAHPGRFLRRTALTVATLIVGALALAGSNAIAAQRQQLLSALLAEDTVALFGALRDVQPWFRWLVVPDGIDPSWIERGRSWSPGDPMVVVHQMHVFRREEDAPFVAATYLRENGLDSDALLVRYLEERLARLVTAPDSAALDRESRVALVVARLFYERPVRSVDDGKAVAGIRQRLLQHLKRKHEHDDETWLHVVSALSGCGRPEDIVTILDAAAPGEDALRGHAGESDRLGLRAAERMIRRAHAAGQLEHVDFAAVWSRIEPWIDRWNGNTHDFSWPMQIAIDGVLEAAVFAASDSDPPAVVPAMRGGSWRIREACELTAGGKFRALARLGDRELWNDLVNWNGVRKGWDAQVAGWLTGAFADDELTDALFWFWASRDDSSDREAFEEAHLKSVFRLAGDAIEYELDPLTLLRLANDEPAEEHLLPLRIVPWDDGAFPTARITFDASSWFGGFPRATLEWIAPQSFWRFRHDGSTCGGAARSAWVRSGALAEGEKYLVLRTPGESEVRLRFDLAQVPPDSWWELVLRQQLAARDFYPYQGQVDLEIRLNGAVVVSSWTVFQKEAHEQHVDLPPARLVPGINDVSIRLARTTTTTYRLHLAMIRQRQVR